MLVAVPRAADGLRRYPAAQRDAAAVADDLRPRAETDRARTASRRGRSEDNVERIGGCSRRAGMNRMLFARLYGERLPATPVPTMPFDTTIVRRAANRLHVTLPPDVIVRSGLIGR